MVHRVVFDSSTNLPKASGVELELKSGVFRTIRASKEIIICAGAVNSPQLLMLSGIGPRAHLERFGVGPNQNHIISSLLHIMLFFS